MKLLLQSLAQKGGYDEGDFTLRLDVELLARMDGTPYSGPGGYTNQSFREVYAERVRQGRPWGQTGGFADTPPRPLSESFSWRPGLPATLKAPSCRP